MSEKNEYYANTVGIMSGLYDVTLNFNAQSIVMIDNKNSPLMQSSNECTVRMSPQHAKALAILLIEQIKKYEENFKIALPLESNMEELWKLYVK